MKRFISAMLTIALVFGLVLSGCSTTRSITYTAHTQPAGDYKQAEISVSSFHFTKFFGSVSVLQRFYEMYPASQYEVVAIEKVSKDWLLATPIGAGALLGGALTVIISPGDDLAVRMILPVSVVAAIGAFGGFVLHQIFGNNYVITYVER